MLCFTQQIDGALTNEKLPVSSSNVPITAVFNRRLLDIHFVTFCFGRAVYIYTLKPTSLLVTAYHCNYAMLFPVQPEKLLIVVTHC